MRDFEPVSETKEALPDWQFDTDQDLYDHAYRIIGGVAAGLFEAEANGLLESQPEGTILATATVLPCHDNNNITRQVTYMGYCAEACRANGLVVRQLQVEEDPREGGLYLVMVSSTAESLAVAEAEQFGDDNPERSSRTH